MCSSEIKWDLPSAYINEHVIGIENDNMGWYNLPQCNQTICHAVCSPEFDCRETCKCLVAFKTLTDTLGHNIGDSIRLINSARNSKGWSKPDTQCSAVVDIDVPENMVNPVLSRYYDYLKVDWDKCTDCKYTTVSWSIKGKQ